MKTKLTITLEEDVIRLSELYAKQTGRSLTELIENYLKTLTGVNEDNDQLSPKLKQIIGAVKLPVDFDEKSTLDIYFQNRHL